MARLTSSDCQVQLAHPVVVVRRPLCPEMQQLERALCRVDQELLLGLISREHVAERLAEIVHAHVLPGVRPGGRARGTAPGLGHRDL